MAGNETLSPSPFGSTIFKTEIDSNSSAASDAVQSKSNFSKTGEFVPQIFASKEEQKASYLVKTASVIYIAYSLLYVAVAVAFILIIVLISRVAVLNSGFDLMILKDVPLMGLVPVLYIVTGMLFAYVGFKMKDESKSSFWFAVFVGAAAPVLTSMLARLFLLPFVQDSQTDINPTLISTTSSFTLNNPITYALWIALISVIISFKRFENDSRQISKFGKIYIGVLFIVILMPAAGLLGYGYFQSSSSDYGFAKAQKQVSYKLYKPKVIPEDLALTSYYTSGLEFADTENAVKLTLGTPFTSTSKQSTTLKVAILRQTGISSNFSLENYIGQTFEPDQVQMARIVTVPNDKFVKSYLVHITTSEVPRGVLMMQTKDNTFLELVYVNAGEQEIINLASNIR